MKTRFLKINKDKEKEKEKEKERKAQLEERKKKIKEMVNLLREGEVDAEDEEAIDKERSPPVETLLRIFKRRRERRSSDALNPKKNPIVPPYTHDHILKVPEGIVSFTHFEFPAMLGGNHSKHLVLLGDVHTDRIIMDDAGQFVLDWVVSTLIKNPDQCVDLFLEMSPDDTNSAPLMRQGPMFGEFRKHLKLIKKFKNIRIHRADMRMGINSLPNYSFAGSKLLQEMVKHISEKKSPLITTIITFTLLCVAIIMHILFGIEYLDLIDRDAVYLIRELDLENKFNNEFFGK